MSPKIRSRILKKYVRRANHIFYTLKRGLEMKNKGIISWVSVFGVWKREMSQAIRGGWLYLATRFVIYRAEYRARVSSFVLDERGDVPGWVLVVLMTTGLVTGIWTIAAPRIESLLRGSLDSMNNVH